MGGATPKSNPCQGCRRISIHAPRGGSDGPEAKKKGAGRNFNPRSPWGERPLWAAAAKAAGIFQSTLPVGGATRLRPTPITSSLFQSTLPVGGATRRPTRRVKKFLFQSTLPVGGATNGGLPPATTGTFQSTLPVGGATAPGARSAGSGKFQSTLPVGGATWLGGTAPWWPGFQSTLPVGGATASTELFSRASTISIHAPRGGSDLSAAPGPGKAGYFNPRSPWGERRGAVLGADGPRKYFNPRSPWGERLD